MKKNLNRGDLMGKAATRAKNKYNAENYDRINLSVPKGKKDAYNKAAKEKGFLSLNKFIVDCIEKGME